MDYNVNIYLVTIVFFFWKVISFILKKFSEGNYPQPRLKETQKTWFGKKAGNHLKKSQAFF